MCGPHLPRVLSARSLTVLPARRFIFPSRALPWAHSAAGVLARSLGWLCLAPLAAPTTRRASSVSQALPSAGFRSISRSEGGAFPENPSCPSPPLAVSAPRFHRRQDPSKDLAAENPLATSSEAWRLRRRRLKCWAPASSAHVGTVGSGHNSDTPNCVQTMAVPGNGLLG